MRMLFLAEFLARERLQVDLSHPSRSGGLKEQDYPFSEPWFFAGGRLPAVRYGWVDAAHFRGAWGSSWVVVHGNKAADGRQLHIRPR